MSAAAILMKQREMIRRHREAGATDSLHACRPDELGLRWSWLFNRMIDRGVSIPVGDGRCFLDLEGAMRFRHEQRLRALIFTVLAIAIFIAVS